MNPTTPTTTSAASVLKPVLAAPSTTQRFRGEVVFMYAFDVAYELRHVSAPDLLGQPLATFSVDSSKRSPKQLFFYRPQMVRLPPVEKFGPGGAVLRYQWTAKLLPVGAISLTVRIPFEVDSLERLADYHDFRFADGTSLHDDARAVAEQIRVALLPHMVRPLPGLRDEEAYTVFCLRTPEGGPDEPEFDSERFLQRNRREIAAALTEEVDADVLSEQECHESTSNSLSYSKRDLVVFDWDAALVVDQPDQFDQTLYVIELANVQLTELEAYDRILDEVIDGAYADLNAGKFRRMASGRRTQRELRVFRVDLARLTDELSNITKFFGDFHAGRLYQGLATRFHLADWRRSIDHKLETLDDIYQLLTSDNTNRWMLIMEGTIVLLIMFEIVKAFIDAK
jgi:hypothetical protein